MTAENLALLIIGIVWPFIFEKIKAVGLEGQAAQWAAVVTCYIVAFAAMVATGSATDPESIIKNGAAVSALAFIVYRQIIKPAAS